MGRTKKVIPEAELLSTPSNKFCELCKNSDMRKVKDTANLAVMTIDSIVSMLEIGGKDLKAKCSNLTKWVRTYTNPIKGKRHV